MKKDYKDIKDYKEDIQKRMKTPIILWVIAIIMDIVAIILYGINYVSASEFIAIMNGSIWIAVMAIIYNSYLKETMKLIDRKENTDKEDEKD